MPDDVDFPDKNTTFMPKSEPNERFSGDCPTTPGPPEFDLPSTGHLGFDDTA